MSAEQQIKVLADYIMAEIPGEPSRWVGKRCVNVSESSEGAGDTAVRLLKQYRHAFDHIMRQLGVPQPDYPTPVANAYEIAKDALDGGCLEP